MDVENRMNAKCMIGTWAWGTGTNGSWIVFGKKNDKKELRRVFKRACELGFHMWDTAAVYGKGSSEKFLGECMQESGNRDKLYLSTKFCPSKKFYKTEIMDSYEGSMERLGIKQPDIYWIHIPNNLEENLKLAIELQKQGKIKSIGLSNVTLEQIVKSHKTLNKEGFSIGGIQNHYSLLNRENGQEKIIDWCNHHHVVYFAYMVLEQGALSGHYDEKHPFPLLSLRRVYFGKNKFKKIAPLLSYEKELANKYHVDPSQIPILWAISKKVTPIIGLTKEKHVDELSKILTIELTTEEIAQLEKIASETGVQYKGAWEA